MFGYLTAFQPELRVRELDTYKAVYCGLCHCLRRHYGMASSAGLSYDFVFLAALGLALEEEEPLVEQRRCVTHPVKRRAVITGQRATRYTAAMQVLLGCGKLEDDKADESGARRARAVAGLSALKGARRLAQGEYPDQAAAIKEQLALLGRAESCHGQSLDSYSHHSGELLAALAAPLGRDDAQRRVLREIGYQLGRWVYLIDAADDWEQDARLLRFNALREAGVETGQGLDAQRVSLLLTDAACSVYTALQLLPLRRYKGILENVAGPGMAARQRMVLGEGLRGDTQGEPEKASKELPKGGGRGDVHRA